MRNALGQFIKGHTVNVGRPSWNKGLVGAYKHTKTIDYVSIYQLAQILQ